MRHMLMVGGTDAPMLTSQFSSPTFEEANSRAGNGEELLSLHDRIVVRRLDDRVRTLRFGVKCWREQSALIAGRIIVIFRTLCAMPTATPSPRLLSVYRSVEYLLGELAAEDKYVGYVLQHYDGKHIFAAIRAKVKLVWSLQSTASWDAEDKEAAEKDRAHCDRILQNVEVSCLPPSLRDQPLNELLARFNRRSLNGWRLTYADLDLSEAVLWQTTVPMPPATPSEPFGSSQPRFLTYLNVRYDGVGFRVVVKELVAEFATPRTVECFTIDAVHRSQWLHPCLVPVVGAYTEKDDGVVAIAALGVVLNDVTQRGFESLYSAIYVAGKRFGLLDCVDMILQVADAMQYILFDASNVPAEVGAAWSTVAPSNVFIKLKPVKADANGEAGTVIAAPGSPSSDVLGGDNVSVLVSPHLFVEHGSTNRWSPPPAAKSKQCYALTCLFIAIISGSYPYEGLQSQKEVAQAVASAAPPFNVPRLIPQRFQAFCALGLALSSANRGFASVQEFRASLMVLRESAKGLPGPTGGHAVVPVRDVDWNDYGW